MSRPLALLGLALIAALVTVGCDKRSDTTGAAPGAATTMPPASAASR